MKLLHFYIDLYRAPNIFATYLLRTEDADLFIKRLKARPREYSLGELQGKHSETRVTTKELVEGLAISEDSEIISAFILLHSKLCPKQGCYGKPESRWMGSHHILSAIEEAQNDDDEWDDTDDDDHPDLSGFEEVRVS